MDWGDVALSGLIMIGGGILALVASIRRENTRVDAGLAQTYAARPYPQPNPRPLPDSLRATVNTGAWVAPSHAAPYLPTISSTERYRGIPAGMLGALVQTESDFDPFAFNPTSGASGIAQIIPRWHPDIVDPFDPYEAIPYAGKYLRQMFDRFGTWDLALAAYNWGPTVLAANGIEDAPAETREYIAKINRLAGIA